MQRKAAIAVMVFLNLNVAPANAFIAQPKRLDNSLFCRKPRSQPLRAQAFSELCVVKFTVGKKPMLKKIAK